MKPALAHFAKQRGLFLRFRFHTQQKKIAIRSPRGRVGGAWGVQGGCQRAKGSTLRRRSRLVCFGGGGQLTKTLESMENPGGDHGNAREGPRWRRLLGGMPVELPMPHRGGGAHQGYIQNIKVGKARHACNLEHFCTGTQNMHDLTAVAIRTTHSAIGANQSHVTHLSTTHGATAFSPTPKPLE
jgi:hypothetical protein